MPQLPELQLNDPVRATHINDELYHINGGPNYGFYLYYPKLGIIQRTPDDLTVTRMKNRRYSKSAPRAYDKLKDLTGEVLRREYHFFSDSGEYGWWILDWERKGIQFIDDPKVGGDQVRVEIHVPLHLRS